MTEKLGDRIAKAAELVGGKRLLYEKAEIKNSTFHRYITGKNTPSVDVAVRIAKAAGVDINWLATGEGPMNIIELETDVCTCPHFYAASSLITPMAQGNLKRFVREIKHILNKQERQIETTRDYLKAIVWIANGGKK